MELRNNGDKLRNNGDKLRNNGDKLKPKTSLSKARKRGNFIKNRFIMH